MHHRAQTIAYSLAIFVLLNALFIVQSASTGEMRKSFSIAFVQTIGDQPWLEPFEMAVVGISDFYEQSADAMMALLDSRGTGGDLVKLGKEMYLSVANALFDYELGIKDSGQVAGLLLDGEYMMDEPIRNIIPWRSFSLIGVLGQDDKQETISSTQIAGACKHSLINK